jgi:hypothetical protein
LEKGGNLCPLGGQKVSKEIAKISSGQRQWSIKIASRRMVYKKLYQWQKFSSGI